MTFPLKSLVEAASKAPIVPVLVVDRIEMAAPLARALVDGGLTIAEVTLKRMSIMRYRLDLTSLSHPACHQNCWRGSVIAGAL